MVLLKVFLVFAMSFCLVKSSPDSVNGESSPYKNQDDEGRVRHKRFLFNVFPGIFNSFPGGYNLFNEDDQVRVLQQQQRVLRRATGGFNQYNQGPGNGNPFSNDDFYVQGLLQQRRVRQKYFEATGERLYSDRGYYDNDNYNNYRFRN
ncbi:hypothetical protein Bhyg_14253 [Pseudolycoriella hygida]|uniref:Uncharacterized protein n=1 Tax=Pseudolycoriella hygida TaxID=35572 RepID=A0A9Q0RX25_9DIPT|nr:hypothetical protein Bhyg_14253 [Pseudolycoriella hygida]